MKTPAHCFAPGSLLCGLVASLLLLVSGLAQAEDRAAKTYDIKDVSEVVAGGGCRMSIIQGDQESLRVEARKDTLERVSVDLSGHKLSLSVKGKGVFHWFDFHQDEVVYVLQVKNLNRLELNGACNASISNWTGKGLAVYGSGASIVDFAKVTLDDFFIELSGASNTHIQQLMATKSEFQLSGAANADIKAAGSSKYLKIEASGASNFRGKPLVAEQAELGASGASNIDLAVSGFLKAGASGASNIRYLGQPKVQSNASGASHVDAMN